MSAKYDVNMTLWFNFILGLNFIFFCFWVWQYMIMSLKQKKIKPRIKLNHNIYIIFYMTSAYISVELS